MEKKIKLVLEDIKTYYMIKNNENFKERLFEAYILVKENQIKSYEEFENCKLGIGAFTYSQITIFDRISNENYRVLLSQHLLSMAGLDNMAKDYGDRLASFGTIGKTPYREKYIKEGYITVGLTEEEKNKFYR